MCLARLVTTSNASARGSLGNGGSFVEVLHSSDKRYRFDPVDHVLYLLLLDLYGYYSPV